MASFAGRYARPALSVIRLMPLPNGLAILIYLSIPLHDYPLLDCEVVNSLVMGFVLIVAFKSTAPTRNTAVGGAEARMSNNIWLPLGTSASHSPIYCQTSPSDCWRMRVGCPHAVTRSLVGCRRQSLGLPVIKGFFSDAQPHRIRTESRIGMVVFMVSIESPSIGIKR